MIYRSAQTYTARDVEIKSPFVCHCLQPRHTFKTLLTGCRLIVFTFVRYGEPFPWSKTDIPLHAYGVAVVTYHLVLHQQRTFKIAVSCRKSYFEPSPVEAYS